jgi:hypothetical protein
MVKEPTPRAELSARRPRAAHLVGQFACVNGIRMTITIKTVRMIVVPMDDHGS